MGWKTVEVFYLYLNGLWDTDFMEVPKEICTHNDFQDWCFEDESFRQQKGWGSKPDFDEKIVAVFVSHWNPSDNV